MMTSARTSQTRFHPWMVLAALALVATTAGCAASPTAPVHYSTYRKTDLVLGTGDEATAAKSLGVHYTGWLYDATKANFRGAQFDSSVGGTPFTFILGAGQVISGWDQGLVGMQIGGVRELIVPPSLAYGDTRRGPIPPNATLVFEIELISVQ